MKGKDLAIIILSIIVVIQFIVIIFLIPVKTIEEVKEQTKINSQWQNITTYKED